MTPPSSEIEAIAQLRELGYPDDLDLTDRCVTCRRTESTHQFDDATVDHTYRFEGDSSPEDSSIVLGVTIPGGDIDGADLKAVLISVYGADIDPAVADFLRGR